MNTKTKVILTTLVAALPAFVLAAGSPVGAGLWTSAWPFKNPDASPEPTSVQIPLFIVLAIVEALAFGLAVSYLAFGRRSAQARVGSGALFSACIFWLLANWWVHDSVHKTNGMNLDGLLVIDYAFHVTLIAATAYVTWVVVRAVKTSQATSKSG